MLKKSANGERDWKDEYMIACIINLDGLLRESFALSSSTF